MSFKHASDTAYARTDGRRADELRPVRITPNFMPYAEGSALIEMGQTRVICTATLEDRVPPSAWSTSQSTVNVRSPRAPRSQMARKERPMRR